MSRLTLFISGQRIPFLSADVSFSIEQLAHTFTCSIAPMVITKPLSVEFKLNDKRIFIGAIDTASSNTASSEFAMSLSGRSLSANMIDSKITMDAVYDQALGALIASVASDFGLTVTSLVDTSALGVIEEFQINAESPVDNFSQLAKEQGVILIERNGVLTIENPAHATLQRVRLEVGKNIKSITIDRNFTKQFYHIEVQGQWNDAHAVVTYAPANTQRKMVIVSDQLQSAASCKARAEYERDLAIAQGLTVSTSIPGLFDELTGDAINRIIPVIDTRQQFNEQMLIKSLTLSVNDSSSETKIELFRPFEEKADV
ncbi:phage tail protein [Aliivibrio finisterrensis]|uniref:Phage tail protein n=1 Tax=Aliivibrio finisterrensis TaxID=511998 RepID=A0ABY0I3B4_9GAMM|nr:phage tail protein [Aliivibrio finisterrensis]RYU50023.1 phage tail protein [Aliivibrio finisterrensis]RYU55724.1 phage tail protein [Aliivibrio finisterrensis]RYU62178.1 phage tail protein [Aliivibrio finisterrensis]RYU80915.1 phage tail protein [Aliivibrio finisterrensis]RYU84472.1 phage tail protein [Aliivibrio finisterrensis]